jgi:glucose dehydrogenase
LVYKTLVFSGFFVGSVASFLKSGCSVTSIRSDRNKMKHSLAALAVVLAGVVSAGVHSSAQRSDAPDFDWPVYRGDPKGNQYAPLADIHAANVHRLERAWEYHTGDANERSTMYVNPVVVDGVMYITTAALKAVALDAATGKELWVFDPAKYNDGRVVRLRNRGVTYWKGAEGARIFHYVRDRAYAIDAKTGALIRSFGQEGFIDLRQDLGAGRGLQEHADHRVARERELRRLAWAHPRL